MGGDTCFPWQPSRAFLVSDLRGEENIRSSGVWRSKVDNMSACIHEQSVPDHNTEMTTLCHTVFEGRFGWMVRRKEFASIICSGGGRTGLSYIWLGRSFAI